MNIWLKLIGSADKPLTEPPNNGIWAKDTSGITIDEITLPIRNLPRSVRQQSHIKLFPEESTIAYSKLKERAASIGR